MLDVHAAQRRNADRPGQHVRNLHLRGIGVTVPDRARELTDFLDQPAKGAICPPLAVSGAIHGLDTVLKLAEVHAGPPDHRKRGNKETRKPDALAVAVESRFAGSSNEPFARRVSAFPSVSSGSDLVGDYNQRRRREASRERVGDPPPL